ncbi:odorant receptor 63a-like isoform X2 [Phymastichus coffea]|uniref:odorant receptor 63a-like isoform X2 n=1 Tax=Phymastichus coffea TaxID=108790 RepID=UPI00273B1BED|nr:odorant receptor 63a-like isoform X2 [Phymastichus coffea]
MLKMYASVSTDEFFNDRLFRLNKTFLKVYGRWPYQSLKIRTSIVIYFKEVIDAKNWNKVVDCLTALIATYGSFIFIANSIVQFDKMTQTLEEMHRNWRNVGDDKEVAILRKHAKTGKMLILVYLCKTFIIIRLAQNINVAIDYSTYISDLCTGTITFFCTIPFFPFFMDIISPLNESRPVTNLLQVQYYVDEEQYYIPIYLHGLQAALAVVYTFITFDSYFIMLVEHACGMFSVLGYKVQSISRLNYETIILNSWRQHEQFISAKLGETIRFHWDCLRFISLIEDSLTIAWLLQLFLNMIIISVCGVQTITRTNEPVHMLQFFMNTTSTVFRLFYICWSGQKISNHSNQFYSILNNIPWYDFPQKSKKLLLLMMLRSSSPCYITAGKMLYLNFDTYCTLMKTSMSYLTMILSTQ